MGIAGMLEASSPTGEVTEERSDSGGWKPITAYRVRRHSGSGLSGRPPSEPFSFLNRATRFIISPRLQFRIVFQSFIASSCAAASRLLTYPMNKLKLTLGGCDYDRTKTILLGRTPIEGVDLVPLPM